MKFFSDTERLDFVSQTVVAKVLNISTQTITSLTRKGIFTRHPDSTDKASRYNLPQTVKAYLEYSRGDGEKGVQGSRSKLVLQQTKKLELQNRKAAGELVSVDEAKKVFSEFANTLRTGMFSLPGRLAAQLAGQSKPNIIRTIIHEEITDAFAESQRIIRAFKPDKPEAVGGNAAGIPDPKSAAKKKPGSMGKRKQNSTKRKRGAGTLAK